MKRLLVASTNRGKAREIEELLTDLPGWTVALLPPDAPPVEETGSTFLENAMLKAQSHGRGAEAWTLADDSGLIVDALGGRPGVHSSRYAPSDRERNDKLLAELRGAPDPDRTARFVCALALARDGAVVWTVQEQVEGRIAPAPSGTHGFGFDPVFFVPEFRRTMAELDPAVKHGISHRGKALRRLREYLRTI